MDNYIQADRRLRSSDDREDAISSTDDGSQPISQSVQDLANDIYKEFESLIKLYGNGFLHNLMPLVIRALENLDSLHSENSDLHLKSLVLSDDHRLLSGEYEKEKKLRKVAENVSCFSRFEEQEAEMKGEYQRLHDLYTNLLRVYLEYVERVRSMFIKSKLDNHCLPDCPYTSDNTCFEVGLAAQTSNHSTGVDQLNRLGNMLNSETLETERQRIMRIIMETTPELYSGGRIFNNSSLSEPCFDELSQGDLPEDDGHDIKSHDGSCTTPQPQSGEPLGNEFAEPVELEVDGDLTDYAGVRREIQNLIKENQELVQTKNALKIVTNDLIGRIDELSCQNFQFSSELNALITNRASMLLRIKDLEQENGQLRREFENSDLYGSLPSDEISESEHLPLSMRFRFSRVEMARVLLERNQYKEQLLELQEAVHLTHNLKVQQTSKLSNTFHGTKRGRIRAFFAKLFNSPQSQQSSSKSSTLSASMNTSQSTIQSMHNSIFRLSAPNEFTISSSLSQISETSNPNTSVSIQKTISDSDLNQHPTNCKISMKQTCIRDLNDSTESSHRRHQRRTSPIQWYSHRNEHTLDQRNLKVAHVYPLNDHPSSVELRCAAVTYPYHSTSHSSTSSPTMNNLLSTTYIRNRLESPKDYDDVNTTGLSTYSNSDQLEHHEAHEQQQSKVEVSKKSMYNHSSDNNSFDYSAVIDDQFSDVRSNIIWLSSFSLKHDLTAIKAPSSSSTSSSSPTMFTGPDYSGRIKSLITIVQVDYKSCQSVDSFAICSSAVLCICSVPEASIEDLTCLENTDHYWEMLPMDTFSGDIETGQSLTADMLETRIKKCNVNAPCSLNECTEFKFLEYDNTNNNTPKKINEIVQESKYHRTSTPTSSSHLSSIKQAIDHLSSTRRLVNALGIIGSVNDVDEVTMSYVATRRRFLIHHADCDSCISNNGDYAVQPSNEMFSSHSSTTNDDLVTQYPCSSSTQHSHYQHSSRKCYSRCSASPTSAQPTVWLGCQNGDLYVHLSVSDWRKCLHAIRLPDSVTQICHLAGQVFVSLANGQIVVFRRHHFHRTDNGTCVITCGRPQCSVNCTITVPSTNSLWAAYRNRILVINAFTLQLVDCFKVHAIQDAQIQTMSWYKDGVWISIRRESILRLYHVISHELIQTLDLNQVIMNLLSNINSSDCGNISKLRSSSLAITTLKSINDHLWIGTSSGLIITIQFQDSLFNRTFQQTPCERQKDSLNLSKRICKAILDCSSVQISTHQHTAPVRFFVTPTVIQQNEDNVNNQCASTCQTTGSMHKPKRRVEKPSYFLVTGGKGHLINSHKNNV
ncbi:putative jnk/sapk-associated protein [Schistosoma mansoni]|uniref:putative jnk/sapk-associated protein n=1 Tax=Schistosoma mansoni TaxID=6183 RepID=UPI00022DC798|nr:putative jnk/sapk-associated protein [Schistosoma mansoni]|eukprot:XP_018653079.1 putative jnk/sapk-associated protein [Schistosoma mansoni]